MRPAGSGSVETNRRCCEGMLNNLNLERLQTFVVAAQAATFAEAARQRGVSVSAVSQQVRGLEAQLGERLFERVGRRVRLTAEGRALLDAAARHLGELDEAVRRLSRARTEVEGLVSVGSPRTFGEAWLVPRLPPLLAAHPGLTIKVDLQVPSVLERRLAEGALDLAILVRPTEQAGLVGRVLAQERFVAVAAPRLIAKWGPAVSEAMLAELRWLIFDRDRPMHEWWWRATFGHRAPPTAVVAEVPSLEVLAGLAEQAVGPVVLPDYLVAPQLAGGRLAVVPVAPRRPAVNSLFLAWRRSVVETARLVAVKAALSRRVVGGGSDL